MGTAGLHGVCEETPLAPLIGRLGLQLYQTSGDNSVLFDHDLERTEKQIQDDVPDHVNGDDGRTRTGTLWTCIAHIITAVIGSGVLSLAWSTAQLGYIVGSVAMICFALVTFVSASLLSDCYRFPHPVIGARNYSYMDAVRVYLGEKQTWICGIIQYISFYGNCVAYTITTPASIRAIQESNCFHKDGHDAPCSYGVLNFTLLFGGVQIILSQIPDLHSITWISIIAAIMSFCYSSIGLGLGLAKVIENGGISGGIRGVPQATPVRKVWTVSQALGDIAFAYPYSYILLEIQDTLKSPPAENKTMKKASLISIIFTTFFYLGCGSFGYAAFGNDTPGNLISGFGFYEPYWIVDFANVCVIVHLVGGYQIYSQPIFAFIDRWSANKFPNSGFVNYFFTVRLPFFPSYKTNLFRGCYRTVYVISTVGIALIFPYFNQVLGVLGPINFWPLAVYFPVQMYFVQNKVVAWSKKMACACMF